MNETVGEWDADTPQRHAFFNTTWRNLPDGLLPPGPPHRRPSPYLPLHSFERLTPAGIACIPVLPFVSPRATPFMPCTLMIFVPTPGTKPSAPALHPTTSSLTLSTMSYSTVCDMTRLVAVLSGTETTNSFSRRIAGPRIRACTSLRA